MPKDLSGKPRPAIIVLHGGGWIEGDKSSFVSLEHWAPGNIIDYAKRGYVAAAVNYRLSGEKVFPAAVEDCKCAVRWLRAHARQYNIDKAHIGAWGNSAGGHLALMLGMVPKEAGLEGEGPYQEQSSMVQAVTSDSGPVDLEFFYSRLKDKRIVEKFLAGPKETFTEQLKKASPITYVSRDNPPMLLLAGGDDPYISPEETDAFVVKLQKAGDHDVTYLRLAKVGHCPHSLVRVPFLQQVVIDFFTRTLIQAEADGKQAVKK